MVHITELPVEILQEILLEVCKCYMGDCKSYVRGRRALRLKLVCKHFRETIEPVLLESRVAEFNDKTSFGTIEALPVTTYRYGVDKFMHRYVVYHTRTEQDAYRGRFVHLRKAAEAYCAETGADLDHCIDEFVWLVLDRAATAPGERTDFYHSTNTWRRNQWSTYYDPLRGPYTLAFNESTYYRSEFEPNINLLSAAAYFNNFPLAKRLLAQGYCPTTHNELLPAPMETAAFGGNAEMLQLLQEHLPDFKDLGRSAIFRFRSKVHHSSLLGAAFRGDLDMVKLALFPPSRAEPDSTKLLDQRYGSVDPESLAGYFIRHAILNTRDWDVYQYLVSAFRKQDRKYGLLDLILFFNVRRGNTDFVRKLVFENGYLGQLKQCDLAQSRSRTPDFECLQDAIRLCHDDMVDFLIDECGIIPALRQHGSYETWDLGEAGNFITVAAMAGSLSLLKKLLAKGASVDGQGMLSWHTAFCAALGLEHFDMARYLLTLRNPSRRWKRQLVLEALKPKKEWVETTNTRWPYMSHLPGYGSISRFLDEIWGEELRQPPPKFPPQLRNTRRHCLDMEEVLDKVDFSTAFATWEISGAGDGWR
ncbi:hypothetical protein QBC34DRAFT_409971 [Podospora aff. communis PSN243]|uniref:F-box domain-containing protein n=1 Tax=Podospora aff. communis PSN243 TaxID=3040156 RepID=A0AAV9GI52_9PEZI|nr:hypothetical protein QBC34DRAFT_409971 [Podospora aff. communis PSN243]